MTIFCLYREAHRWKPIPGYAEAFRNFGIEFWCADDSIAFDASPNDVLRSCPPVALDFYAAHGLADCAAAQFRHVAGHGFRETMEGTSLSTRAWLKSLRARWS